MAASEKKQKKESLWACSVVFPFLPRRQGQHCKKALLATDCRQQRVRGLRFAQTDASIQREAGLYLPEHASMSRAAGTLAKSYAHARTRQKRWLMRLAGILPKTTLYLMAQKYFMNAHITARIHALMHDTRWPLVIPRWGRPNCAGLSSTATYDACARRGLHSNEKQVC